MAEKTPKVEKTWPEWTDFLGNTYRPGDYVVYAHGFGRSGARLVFAEVVRINRVNSRRQEIFTTEVTRGPSGVVRTQVPSCTVTVRPIEGGRRKYWTVTTEEFVDDKLKTLQEPANIIRVDNHYMARFQEIEDAEVEKAWNAITKKYEDT